MVTRTKTKEECIAAALLLGDDWTYGIMSHTFMRGASLENGNTMIAEMRCAETFELITNKEASARRAEERQRQNEEIQYNIWQREEARTHAESENES